MALKKVKKIESENLQNRIKQEESNTMIQTNNYSANDNKFNNTLLGDNESSGFESFFESENLSSMSTPLNLEIEIKPQTIVDEGRYDFVVRALDIERNVSTAYGVKDKLVIEFNIKRVEDGEDVEYNLKQKYNISNDVTSRFFEVYKDLTGQEPSGKVNLRNLLNVKGKCEVKHILMQNGRNFPRIVNINAQIYS
ncbi:hypothetical protein [Clostridium butyricum]|uniref:hypothetical protein n=1 Tax=Clostridium butyricum TaxID=1492 RepID=UPI001F574B57|nr:hypothetical protein [Clostridium butyricum]